MALRSGRVCILFGALTPRSKERLWGRGFFRPDVWPVIHRELREAARKRGTHWLSAGSVVLGMLMLWGVMSTGVSGRHMGGMLLGTFHTLLLMVIFFTVPVSAADCIARERRDETLGLLFLTPLKAGGIVAGKAAVQGLRLMTLWLAVLPLLTISFMAGGVTWFDTLTALSMEFCAALLCLGAGLLASSLVRDMRGARVAAYVLAGGVLFGVGELALLIFYIGCAPKGFPLFAWMALGPLAFTGLIPTMSGVGWSALTSSLAGAAGPWRWIFGTAPIVIAILFYAICRFAAWRMDRSWQDRPLSIRGEKLWRRFCTPLFKALSRRRRQRTLDRNPIIWLQQYSWKSRIVKWFLFLGLLPLCIGASLPGQGAWVDRDLLFIVLLVVFACGYAYAGVSGFMEEKRSGVLEMILVTPVSTNQIIFGRSWGLWMQFLPAALVLGGMW